MGKIYVGQTALTIRLTTSIDLSSAKTTLIKYKKPDGTEGSWVATVFNVATGIISYVVASASILDQSGVWVLWAHITFNDDTVAAGEAVKQIIYKESE